jgi:hypothetical protein
MPTENTPIWGAAAIAVAAGLIDEHGNPKTKTASRLLKLGLLPGRKIGDVWTTTPAQLRRHFEVESALRSETAGQNVAA